MLIAEKKGILLSIPTIEIDSFSDGGFVAKIVSSEEELLQILRLRRDVFENEIAGKQNGDDFADWEDFDSVCHHIGVFEKSTGKAIGTYRLNPPYLNGGRLYSSGEFQTEAIPEQVLRSSVELGRAAIAREYRNTRILFLLWKVLASYVTAHEIRYLFGCCSVFTQDPVMAASFLKRFREDGAMLDTFEIAPREDARILTENEYGELPAISYPPLVSIYLRIGAKICGEPAIDRKMKTIDFFVLFDLLDLNERYRAALF
ncbi:MAG: GNAT family N-acyltransferase [Pyrinomonadaceae bacterium]